MDLATFSLWSDLQDDWVSFRSHLLASCVRRSFIHEFCSETTTTTTTKSKLSKVFNEKTKLKAVTDKRLSSSASIFFCKDTTGQPEARKTRGGRQPLAPIYHCQACNSDRVGHSQNFNWNRPDLTFDFETSETELCTSESAPVQWSKVFLFPVQGPISWSSKSYNKSIIKSSLSPSSPFNPALSFLKSSSSRLFRFRNGKNMMFTDLSWYFLPLSVWQQQTCGARAKMFL